MLGKAGTELCILPPEARYRTSEEDKRLYHMVGTCGLLTTITLESENGLPVTIRGCAAYGDPERPETCQKFAEGGRRCRLMQQHAGIITLAQFTRYERTQPYRPDRAAS